MKKWILICVCLYSCNGGSPSNKLAETHIPQAIDILFVIDNGGDMVEDQLQLGRSIGEFLSILERNFTEDYHIAVITTGVESMACAPCDEVITQGCFMETGENGLFSDRVGKYQYSGDTATYSIETDVTCRVVSPLNRICLYDDVEQKGTLLVGKHGCGYERALAAMRMALANSSQAGGSFLRSDAALAVVILAAEEDCGEVDDVYEFTADGGNICYFAAKGEGPEPGNTTYTPMTYHPSDPEKRPYQLTAVEEYKSYLEGLKGGKTGLVKFAAIVGVEHVNDLDTTTIEYEWSDRNRWVITDACTTSGCIGDYCFAEPGTRYIQMAELFVIGENGFIDTICQTDFDDTMKRLGKFLSCPGRLLLEKTISDPQKTNLMLNDEPIPRYSCTVENHLESCQYTDDPSCSVGDCVETWSYFYPSLDEPHGAIVFAKHFDACSYAEGGVLRIDLAK